MLHVFNLLGHKVEQFHQIWLCSQKHLQNGLAAGSQLLGAELELAENNLFMY